MSEALLMATAAAAAAAAATAPAPPAVNGAAAADTSASSVAAAGAAGGGASASTARLFGYVRSCDVDNHILLLKIHSLEGPRPAALRLEGAAESAQRWQAVRRAASLLRAALGLSWLRLVELAGLQCTAGQLALLEGAGEAGGAPPSSGEGRRLWEALERLLGKAAAEQAGGQRQGLAELYVEAKVHGDGRLLCLPTQTSFTHFVDCWRWDEWLSLPVNICDLPRDARVTLTVWDSAGPGRRFVVGGTSLELFDEDGTLKWGRQITRLWPYMEGDPLGRTTPSYAGDDITRLESLSKQHANKELPQISWLDKLVNDKLGQVMSTLKAKTNAQFLTVEFLRFETDVLYCELGGALPSQTDLRSLEPDPEVHMAENLVELKHHQQVRSHRRGPSSRDINPNTTTRDHLYEIVGRSPMHPLSIQDKDLLWRYRFYLTREKKALTKVMRATDWTNAAEARQAVEAMDLWETIEIDDALELLGKDFAHPAPRRYAVQRLEQADNEELGLYMLQLVQAIKYEPKYNNFTDADILAASSTTGSDRRDSASSTRPRQQSESLAGPVDKSGSAASAEGALSLHQHSPASKRAAQLAGGSAGQASKRGDLESFLIERSRHDLVLANMLYWYLYVEASDKESVSAPIYQAVFERYLKQLKNSGEVCRAIHDELVAGHTFVKWLQSLSDHIRSLNVNRPKKIEKLKEILQEPIECLVNKTPLALDPTCKIKGVDSTKAHVYKSALLPLGLDLITTKGTYGILFKNGDDLRQDQLVLQVITLMDRLLKKENLDLHLTPYECLANSPSIGMVHRITSEPLAKILGTVGSLQKYWREFPENEDANAPYGIKRRVIDNFVCSCAGYCVITYILGVGDRHLDNLLVTTDGDLFHVDFGYMLGRDPKPYPPPMKLTKDMIEAMGGANSVETQRFRSHCYNCFLILRKHSNLILNLFRLMLDSNVHDIALDRDKTLGKVYDKFRLDLSDEQAVQYFDDLMVSSTSMIMPKLVEVAHTIAQYLRK